MPAPITPGSFVGQHQDGYFWNGTAWEPGETGGVNSAAAPSTAFGGTVINQQNATPAPAPAPASAPAPSTAAAAAKRASILATIMRIESGGKNITQSLGTRDVNNNYGAGGGDPAQGFYQITGGTWREHGGDKTGHKSPIDANYQTQLQVAQNIPVARWGPATQQALKSAGYEIRPGETLGQMLARYSEDPTATRPEDVGGSSAGGTPPAPVPTAGLLTPSTPVDPAAAAAAEQARKDKEQEQTFADMTKSGMGLLAKAAPAPVKFAQAPMDAHIPEAKIPPLPNYTQAAQQPDFMQMLMQQRLQRRA